MNPTSTPTLSLSRLKMGVPALTEPVGSALIEACMVCFEDQGHTSGVQMEVTGSYNATFAVTWEGDVTDPMRRAWGDEEAATEHAAYGIAILLIEKLTEYTAIARARRGTGIDFWLGTRPEDTAEPFEYKARLEVSGIRQGNVWRIGARVSQKKQQAGISDREFPAYIVVVEFSRPSARVVRHEYSS